MSGGPLFYLAELEAYRAGSSAGAERGHMTRPRMVPLPASQPLESTETILASDLGYRNNGSVYPPVLDRAFEIDRRMALAPDAAAAAAGWGAVRLLNPRGRWDAIAATRSSDGRPIRVLMGRKGYDAERGIDTDPAYGSLTIAFAGVALGWFLSETALEVPLRDATYFIERPVQGQVYSGTGGYEGTAALAGVPKPKTRGGTPTDPVREVAPLLIDPENRIFAYSDGPGTVVALYEGGDANITYAGDTANLYAGVTPAGQYRTDNSRGLIQLGSTPVRQITVDVTGAFPIAGARTTAASIARHLLTEDLGLPASMLDAASFEVLDAACPYVAGWHWGPQPADGAEALALFLRGLGAKLVPLRDGRLRVLALRAIPAGAAPVATFSPDNAVSVLPRRLGEPLDPPAYRWRVGYQRAQTVQTAGLSPVLTETRLQFLASPWRFGGWASGDILSAYRRPSDPPGLETALLAQADATALAGALGALWGVRRRLYDVVVPVEVGVQREIGDVVRLVYPMDDLRSGRLGQVVGEQFRSGDATVTLQVLV